MIIISMSFSCDFYLMTRKRYARATMMIVVSEAVASASLILVTLAYCMTIMILRNAGYPDDPALHGLIAGLWSSLSGLGRFTSRVGSGILVDHIGFDKTAMIVTGLQVLIVSNLRFQYLVLWYARVRVAIRAAYIFWELPK